jgi:hypothetical protein
MRGSVLLCLVVAGCAGAPDDLGVAEEEIASPEVEPGMRVHWKQGVQAPATSSGNLMDFGGRILPHSNTYAIWWGTPSNFPADAQAGIESVLEGLQGSSFLNIATQYMRGASVSSSFQGHLTDTTSSPPTSSPSTSTIVSEACRVINAHGLTADPTAIYFVFTSNYPSGQINYCAWHDSGTCNRVKIQVAYMPNLAGISGCSVYTNCNSYSMATKALANVTSHEFMEAITDASPRLFSYAWIDSSFAEVADKCAWQFSSCVPLPDATNPWKLQKEWSNSASTCVLQ